MCCEKERFIDFLKGEGERSKASPFVKLQQGISYFVSLFAS
jgi:hypothetical protein